LISRLRQAPFFLSLRVVNQILERLPVEVEGRDGPPTMYDLYNTMTFLGTHAENISATHRSRLRLGAGEFTRHESTVCRTCRQLLLKRQTTISRPEPSRGQEAP